MSAKSWDSYKETLYEILQEFRPENILEFGPGFSTEIMGNFPSVNQVHSLENEREFYEKVSGKYLGNVKFIYEPDLKRYADYEPRFIPDLIFVDGRNRSSCLLKWKESHGPVMLHDAAREEYQEAVNHFKFKVWTDEGNTVSLTNFEENYKRMEKCLRNLRWEPGDAG